MPERKRPRWPWISLLPLGLGAWAPALAGQRAGVTRWVALGIGWSVITLAGWILAAATNAHDHGIGGLLILVGWIGAIATSFTIRGAYERRVASPLMQATERAEDRLSDRERARRLVRENPALAAEMGVGRPDLPGATAAGLVDVNNASAAALATLPGVDDELATKIVENRAAVGGFSSVEDLGATMDLDGPTVEGLRGCTVFLPRAGARHRTAEETS
jgi:DNA uptake protein ComE-like DNA-binding protein